MIISENQHDNIQVRIHDDFCKSDTSACIQSVSKIVSHSYKRRILENNILDSYADKNYHSAIIDKQ